MNKNTLIKGGEKHLKKLEENYNEVLSISLRIQDLLDSIEETLVEEVKDIILIDGGNKTVEGYKASVRNDLKKLLHYVEKTRIKVN